MKTLLTSPYILFNRKEWAQLRESEPMRLQEDELVKLKGINEEISLEEVSEIYLPLSRLLNYYFKFNVNRQAALSKFLSKQYVKIPYVIGIAGSVSVGKSTTARVLQALLSRWDEKIKVELITTDGFLYPNYILEQRGLMDRKGFPESYNSNLLLKFLSDIKSGKEKVLAPVYSHLIYDVVPDQFQSVDQPDILILEGLNVLQSSIDYPQRANNVFVSDFVDFSIYVDADEQLLEYWYIARFLKFRKGAFSDINSYFHHYTLISDAEAVDIAKGIWDSINKKNLLENILPTKERASLILNKGSNHSVDYVRLRK